MIDLYCHLLPMHDGETKHWPQMLQMARDAHSQGIRHLMVTPHHSHRHPFPAEQIASLTRQLSDTLRAGGVDLQIHAGQEFGYHDGYDTDSATAGIKTLGNSHYVLVRLPTRRTPARLPAFLRLLRQKGRRAVIAHPELHLPFLKKPSHMNEFLSTGVLFLVTAPSLLGHHGLDVQKGAMQMVRDRQAQLVGSNAHVYGHWFQVLFEAYEKIKNELGTDASAYLLENAGKLISGQVIMAGSAELRSSGPPEYWHRIDLALRGRKTGGWKDRIPL
jgi:protein-tyrosine phosphatase